jgi:hypothetical protein
MKIETTNRYIWEGEGDDLDPAINWWMAGYQFMPGDRMIYKYDTERKCKNYHSGAGTAYPSGAPEFTSGF